MKKYKVIQKHLTLDEFHERQLQSQEDIMKGRLIEHKTVKKKHVSK